MTTLTSERTEFESLFGYRYVGNSPVNYVDPSGLAPPPKAYPPYVIECPAEKGPPVYPPCYQSKADLLSGIPQCSATKLDILRPNYGPKCFRADQGSCLEADLSKLAASGELIGTDGAFPCVGVIIVTKTKAYAYHFDPNCQPYNSICLQDKATDTCKVPRGTTCVVFGGNNEASSNVILNSVLIALGPNATYCNTEGLWYDAKNNRFCRFKNDHDSRDAK
jgi:hypothetical protein